MQALFIIIPFFVLLILNLPYKKNWRKYSFYVGLFIALFQILLSLTSGALIWNKIIQVFQINFITELKIDYISLVVLFTIGLIAGTALWVGRFLPGKNDPSRDDFNFVNLIILAVMGMNGVVMVRDLFSLYVFLEITAVASFILISINRDKFAFEGAFKYLIMSALATIFMLAAIALIFMNTQDLSYGAVSGLLKNLGNNPNPQLILALILFITGFSIKAGVVPFHGWLPDAYSSASSPVSVFLAGIVTKVAGVYTLIRLSYDVFNNNPAIGNIMMLFGLLSIIIGAFAAIGQSDFKRMLAYSSISQIGYIIFAAGIGTPLALTGAMLHFFNHAIFKSSLFVNSAAVEKEAGTRDINKLGGLASKMPITGGTSIVSFLSTAGIPPLSGFWSKFIIILSAWITGFHSYAVIALLASILTLVYFLILQRRVFFGKLAIGFENIKEGNIGVTFPALILSGITILLGLLFPAVVAYLQSNGLLNFNL